MSDAHTLAWVALGVAVFALVQNSQLRHQLVQVQAQQQGGITFNPSSVWGWQ